MSRDDTFERVDALLQIALRLACTAPSGRLVLARVAANVEDAWIGDRWRETLGAELAAVRAAPPEPLDARRVESILRGAWGAKPTDELDSLDPEPVAITEAAQVHRGELEGRPVAVKLLRPGLVAGVRQDLALLEGLLAPAGAAFPALDPGALVRELRELVLSELDLEHEAGAQRRFHRALRKHDWIHVPAPITRLSHESVLVGEWVEGTPLSALGATSPDRDAACAALVRFVAGGLHAGFVHADPDPDDVLVLADGRIAILDFGTVADVDPGRAAAAADAVAALRVVDGPTAGDDAAAHAALADALGRTGWAPPELAPALVGLARGVLGELLGPAPARLDSATVITLRDRLHEHPRTLARLIRHGALAPADLWPARAIAQLFGTIARVGATGPWPELLEQGLRTGWDGSL